MLNFLTMVTIYYYVGLAQDDNLHYLSIEDQLFYSSQHELVPECADLYLHSDLVKSSFTHIPVDNLTEVTF